MLARREEMTPVLLGILKDAAIHPETYLEEEGFWKLTTFAAFLLAQWRDTRAYRPLCATLNLPAKIADDLWGDMICEDMGRILASVYDGDDSPLRSVMANLQSGRPCEDPDHAQLVEDTIAETNSWCYWEKPAAPTARKKRTPLQ